MSRSIRAIFENGVLRPLDPVDLPAHRTYTLTVLEEDLSAIDIAEVAASGRAFDFLADDAEDVYSPDDGEPL